MDWLTLTHTNSVGQTLAAWQKRSQSRFGRWRFARAVCRRAPYFSSIKPHFLELRPALCIVAMAKHKGVSSLPGTVDSSAIATLCELAAGTVTDVTIPPAMRWTTRGMTIEYLRRAETDVTATARLDKSEWSAEQNVGVPVSVVDRNGTEVVRAVITMHVAPRTAGA
jgi:acyl-coenzyme A thioesterase PaaI-like protein